MSRTAPRTTVSTVHTTLVSALKGAILLGAASAGMAQAQQSPALDRMSISAGAFYAEPKIHVGGDTVMAGSTRPTRKSTTSPCRA